MGANRGKSEIGAAMLMGNILLTLVVWNSYLSMFEAANQKWLKISLCLKNQSDTRDSQAWEMMSFNSFVYKLAGPMRLTLNSLSQSDTSAGPIGLTLNSPSQSNSCNSWYKSSPFLVIGIILRSCIQKERFKNAFQGLLPSWPEVFKEQ